MEFIRSKIEGAFFIKPRIFKDSRGFFFEGFNSEDFSRAGLDFRPVQENFSSSEKNVVRGLHLQKGVSAQAKIVRVLKGEILDVLVDLRPESPTFGMHESFDLKSDGCALFIPKGVAHGFAAKSSGAFISYLVDAPYDKSAEAGVHPFDEELAVEWGVSRKQAVLSEKDAALPSLGEYLRGA